MVNNKMTVSISDTNSHYTFETGRVATPKGGYATHGVKPVIVSTNKHSVSLLKNQDLNITEYYLRSSQLFTADGKKMTTACAEIIDAGGCKQFFESEAEPCLSLIVNDRQCSGLSPELVSEALDVLDIQSSTTFDEATYLNRPAWGARKIEELRTKNEDLVHNNPNCEFRGIVKGSNIEQIQESIQDLEHLGTKHYIFHVGAYLATRRRYDIRKAIQFGTFIRSEVPELSVYGLGSRQSLDDFAFSDGAVTANYIIETRNGKFTGKDGVPRSVKSGRNGKTPYYPVTDMDLEALRTYRRIEEDCRLAGLKYHEQFTYQDLYYNLDDEICSAKSSNTARGKC